MIGPPTTNHKSNRCLESEGPDKCYTTCAVSLNTSLCAVFGAILLLGSAALVQDRAACSRQFSVCHAHLGLEGLVYERKEQYHERSLSKCRIHLRTLVQGKLGNAAKHDFAHEFTGLCH